MKKQLPRDILQSYCMLKTYGVENDLFLENEHITQIKSKMPTKPEYRGIPRLYAALVADMRTRNLEREIPNVTIIVTNEW